MSVKNLTPSTFILLLLKTLTVITDALRILPRRPVGVRPAKGLLFQLLMHWEPHRDVKMGGSVYVGWTARKRLHPGSDKHQTSHYKLTECGSNGIVVFYRQ